MVEKVRHLILFRLEGGPHFGDLPLERSALPRDLPLAPFSQLSAF
jgi:hypothetical protein